MFDVEIEIEKWLNEDELAAVREAQANGTSTCEYFFTPECGCDGLFMPYYCEDCEKWHQQWTGTYFDVVQGEWTYGFWTCDSGGDWDYCDMGPVTELTDDHYIRQLDEAIAAEKAYNWATEEAAR